MSTLESDHRHMEWNGLSLGKYRCRYSMSHPPPENVFRRAYRTDLSIVMQADGSLQYFWALSGTTLVVLKEELVIIYIHSWTMWNGVTHKDTLSRMPKWATDYWVRDYVENFVLTVNMNDAIESTAFWLVPRSMSSFICQNYPIKHFL